MTSIYFAKQNFGQIDMGARGSLWRGGEDTTLKFYKGRRVLWHIAIKISENLGEEEGKKAASDGEKKKKIATMQHNLSSDKSR